MTNKSTTPTSKDVSRVESQTAAEASDSSSRPTSSTTGNAYRHPRLMRPMAPRPLAPSAPEYELCCTTMGRVFTALQDIESNIALQAAHQVDVICEAMGYFDHAIDPLTPPVLPPSLLSDGRRFVECQQAIDVYQSTERKLKRALDLVYPVLDRYNSNRIPGFDTHFNLSGRYHALKHPRTDSTTDAAPTKGSTPEPEDSEERRVRLTSPILERTPRLQRQRSVVAEAGTDITSSPSTPRPKSILKKQQ
ncbi:hypothetical protein BGX28_001184 [Mortierella sp. GBA30]|nr:hypothetical protein BGX28_001184 [Mortierella sp. GBA30]